MCGISGILSLSGKPINNLDNKISLMTKLLHHRGPDQEGAFISSDKKFGLTEYEKMISAIDNWLGKLFDQINLEETFTIVTADHGEYVPFLETEDGRINIEPSITEKTLWKLGNKIPKDLLPLKRKMGMILRTSREKIKSAKINEDVLTPYQKRILFENKWEKIKDENKWGELGKDSEKPNWICKDCYDGGIILEKQNHNLKSN